MLNKSVVLSTIVVVLISITKAEETTWTRIGLNKIFYKKHDEVTVSCSCEGPELCTNIEWTYMNLDGMYSKKRLDNYTLVTEESAEKKIEQVRFEATESFTISCTFFFPTYDPNTITKYAYVSNLDEIMKIEVLPNPILAKGETLELSCIADKVLFHSVNWFKNNELIIVKNRTSFSLVETLKTNETILKITDIEREESGKFECRAEGKESIFNGQKYQQNRSVNILVLDWIARSADQKILNKALNESMEFTEFSRIIEKTSDRIDNEAEKPQTSIQISTIVVIVVILVLLLIILGIAAFFILRRVLKKNTQNAYDNRTYELIECEQTPISYKHPDIIPGPEDAESSSQRHTNTVSTTLEMDSIDWLLYRQSSLIKTKSRAAIYGKDFSDKNEGIDNANVEDIRSVTSEEPIKSYSNYIRRSAAILQRAKSIGIKSQVLDEYKDLCMKYEFPMRNLKFVQDLGSGAFGYVKLAYADGLIPGEKTAVAVKGTKGDDKKMKEALLAEIKVMVHIGLHKNVVNLLGILTVNINKGEFMIMVEYCALGNIRDYLRENKTLFFNDNPSESGSLPLLMDHQATKLTMPELLSWSFQVTRGMDFLASKRVIHGDLAARNILLCHDNFVKICDFGLARFKQENNLYKKRSSAPLPFKWIALESIEDGIFSTYSDIWSFGVVLWEIFSFGEEPYPEIKLTDICMKLKTGYRMNKPQHANQALYNIMLNCWSENPQERPQFGELELKLGKLLNKMQRYLVVSSNEPYVIINRGVEQHLGIVG